MNINNKIFIAGAAGMVGSSLVKMLNKKGYKNIIKPTRQELDLMNQKSVYDYLGKHKPDVTIVAAALVGGILANNKYRADFIFNNLQIQNNVIFGSHLVDVKTLLFLGSSCVYPKSAKQPMKEEYLLTGPLEYTNEPYAIAKIAGIKLCDSIKDQFNKNYFSVMPSNLYGLNDNFDPETSHFLPAIIRKILLAKINKNKEIIVWGTGSPKRELLFVDDLAEACVMLLEKKFNGNLINIGSGTDYSIDQIVKIVMKVVDYKCNIKYDKTKPDGTMRKILDISQIEKIGWYAKTNIESGIRLILENSEFIKVLKNEKK